MHLVVSKKLIPAVCYIINMCVKLKGEKSLHLLDKLSHEAYTPY
jgi:hypothetical protein